MKNFLRALRFIWPYRVKLILSVLCAVIVALLWGANFMAISPVLNLLGKDQNLQAQLDAEIDAKLQQIAEIAKTLEDREKIELPQVMSWPDEKAREKRLVELTRLTAKDEAAISFARSQLYWLKTARLLVGRFAPEDRFETLAWLLAIVVISIGLKGFFDFWQESLVGSAVSLSLFDLRNRFYRAAINYDVSQFTEEGTHELMARFTSDMDALSAGCKTLFGKVVAEPLKAASCVVFACLISWRLTLLFLVVVPIALFIMHKVGRYMKKASRRVLECMSGLYKILQETFQGIRVVKAFTMEPYERRRFFLGTKDYYHRGMWVIHLEAISGPVMELLGALAIAGALMVGAYLVMTGETHIFGLRMTIDPLTPAALLNLYALLAAIADPVRKLSNVYTKIQAAGAAADRIFQAMDTQPKVRNDPGAPLLPRHHESVEFRGVCFSYTPGHPVLSNVSFRVRFGETIAIVGRNGSGKTTLVGMLPRFFDPDHGSVLIDGHDIRRVNLRSLRQQIGLVSQDTILFDDTIFNNIAYGRRHASPEQVEAAARQALAHDFIVKLRHGYQTRIGEMGGALSGGQKQRIALARAILRDPALLILDEATSAADVEVEAGIQAALRSFMKNRTTFLITHRLSMLEIADRIVVLENGRVEAIGTHQELMQCCPTYQRLQEVQSQRQAA
ncbi:MAG: ABC transporter ATP-binding protein/permease [Gemmatales bacterium]|nr:ABC transporter ATP-binding protein/permease [Gemmatales bacterium]MDW8387181.1 ABC transporter ATP-binding protein [Gemmatales bacterium]